MSAQCENEKSSLVKYGHTLSIKVLYSSPIQTQNVKLAFRISNENNVDALNHVIEDRPHDLASVSVNQQFYRYFC